MTSTTILPSRKLSLQDMPPEIVLEIFWYSLELNLYAVSRKTRRSLLNQRKLVRFLLLLAFGSPQVTNKIIHNNGDDCSSILRGLPFITALPSNNAYTLPRHDRVKLQQAIVNSGWFKLSSLVEVSRANAEYLIQHLWTDQGITTSAGSVQAYANRNVDKGALLQIEGLTGAGDFRRLDVDCFGVTLELHNGPVASADWDHIFVRLLHIQCLPENLLEASLAHANCNRWMDGMSMGRTRLSHPIPNILHFLHEFPWDWGQGSYEDDFLTVSPQPVTNIISEAIRRGNHCVLKALKYLSLTADDDNLDLLNPIKPEHFIAAARGRDQTAIELMWLWGHAVFPFQHVDVIAWMRHAETADSSARLCTNRAFIDYLEYYKEELAENGSPEDFMDWKHGTRCRCKLTGVPMHW